jgi:hypothetical protein
MAGFQHGYSGILYFGNLLPAALLGPSFFGSTIIIPSAADSDLSVYFFSKSDKISMLKNILE